MIKQYFEQYIVEHGQSSGARKITVVGAFWEQQAGGRTGGEAAGQGGAMSV